MRETPGIAMWALRGARRLYQRGHFAETRRGRESQDEFSRLNSPITSFIEDCFQLSPIPSKGVPSYVTKDRVWTAYEIWRAENHQKWTPTRDRMLQSFFRASRAFARRSELEVKDYRPRYVEDEPAEKRARAYCGIELTNDWDAKVDDKQRRQEIGGGIEYASLIDHS